MSTFARVTVALVQCKRVSSQGPVAPWWQGGEIRQGLRELGLTVGISLCYFNEKKKIIDYLD